MQCFSKLIPPERRKGRENHPPSPFHNDFNLLRRRDQIIGSVDQGVALNGLDKHIFLIVGRITQGLGMSGKVGHSVDKAVGVPANVPQIGGVEIPPLHILPDAGDILAVDLRGLLVHRQKQVDVLHDLLIGQFDFIEAGELRPQPPHILFRQEQGVVGLVHLRRQISNVDRRPGTLRRGHSQIQRVLAHHPNGRHGDLDGTAAIVGAAEHQIGVDLLPFDDVLVRELCQNPDPFAVLEGTCRLILDALPQQGVGKRKRLRCSGPHGNGP